MENVLEILKRIANARLEVLDSDYDADSTDDYDFEDLDELDELEDFEEFEEE